MNAPYWKIREDGSAAIVRDGDDAQPCGRCGRAATMFVHRNGKLLCTLCDVAQAPEDHKKREASFLARMATS